MRFFFCSLLPLVEIELASKYSETFSLAKKFNACTERTFSAMQTATASVTHVNGKN